MRSAHKSGLSRQEIEQKLIDAGVNPSSQRLAIAQFLLCEADHPTAEEVYGWAQKNLPKISLATVYNTLECLEEASLVRKYRFPFMEKVIYDVNTEDHFHFYDRSSGRLVDLHADEVTVEVKKGSKARRAQVEQVELLLTGKWK